jgi:hypothetical protein
MQSAKTNIRWRWLRFLYVYTIAGAGGTGLVMILAPGFIPSLFRMPAQDPFIYGVAGSIWLAFGILSALGLRAPVRFLPVLLMQLCYKTIWLAGVVLPLLFRGNFPMYGVVFTLVMASYVVLDLIAIPFSGLFREEAKP